MDDFFPRYFDYIGETECPTLFHRWCAISGIGAVLGRNMYLEHGHFQVNPNIYAMLIGAAGTRKSTAIKLMRKLIVQAGYDTIAADKTTKEKFLLDLSGESGDPEDTKGKNILDTNLWGDDDADVSTRPAAECYIMADEWNDFTSLGNIEFYSLLGTFWDFSGIYKNRIKNGKSVSINNPTISIIGGNTPTGFALAFPSELLGQGFLSRLILVHGANTNKRIPFPPKPDVDKANEMVKYIQAIRANCQGPVGLSSGAEKFLAKIYNSHTGIEDPRFDGYSNRRFVHLLKVCVVVAAMRMSRTISDEDVLLANTILAHTEHLMPAALGEFGKGRYSAVTNRIVEILSNTNKPLDFEDIYKLVSQDLDKKDALSEILSNLRTAGKLLSVGRGFMLKPREKLADTNDFTDFKLLTPEERGEK